MCLPECLLPPPERDLRLFKRIRPVQRVLILQAHFVDHLCFARLYRFLRVEIELLLVIFPELENGDTYLAHRCGPALLDLNPDAAFDKSIVCPQLCLHLFYHIELVVKQISESVVCPFEFQLIFQKRHQLSECPAEVELKSLVGVLVLFSVDDDCAEVLSVVNVKHVRRVACSLLHLICVFALD
jgi:hypothetical protein